MRLFLPKFHPYNRRTRQYHSARHLKKKCIQCPGSGSVLDNIREWTGLEFAKSQRAVENREKWRKLVVKSSVVP